MSKFKGAGLSDDSGVLFVTVIEAKNLAAMCKGGTSDPYCSVKSTFNKQSFKTSYTTEPAGHILLRLWDRGKWGSDDFLGQVAIGIRELKNGKPLDSWFTLENEPKKTKDKIPNRPTGEIHVILHYPSGLEISTGINSSSPVKGKNGLPVRVFDKYTIGKELGRGGFSIVKEAKCIQTGERFAMKIIEKKLVGEDINLLQREIDIMRKLNHKNIIELFEVFEEEDTIYLVLELVTGGELFDQIISRGSYSERDAAYIVKQILEAVQYMHSHGIAHRDLKPENLLVSGPNSDQIKVTDFGLSKDFSSASLFTSCGTPDYVAPEVLTGKAYDNSVDIWSLGVITYILLCGFPPFYGANDPEIFEKILRAEYDFPSESWDPVSDDAKNFIKSILILEASKRPTAVEALQHPWMLCNTPSFALQTFKKSDLAAYNAKRLKQRGRY